MFSTSFSWPPAQFWEGTPPPCAAGRCCCSPGALSFHEFIVIFLKLRVLLSLSHPMEWVGLLWEGAGSAQTQLRAPSWGSNEGLCPSPGHAWAQLSSQPPKIPGTLCFHGFVALEFSWALVNPCWNGQDTASVLQVPPLTPLTPRLSSPHSVFSQPFARKSHEATTVESRGNKYK